MAVQFLNHHEIRSRAFILLRPPFMSEEEGIYWAKKSIDFAFDSGVESCIIIPVRTGNGTMEILMERSNFDLPYFRSLERRYWNMA